MANVPAGQEPRAPISILPSVPGYRVALPSQDGAPVPLPANDAGRNHLFSTFINSYEKAIAVGDHRSATGLLELTGKFMLECPLDKGKYAPDYLTIQEMRASSFLELNTEETIRQALGIFQEVERARSPVSQLFLGRQRDDLNAIVRNMNGDFDTPEQEEARNSAIVKSWDVDYKKLYKKLFNLSRTRERIALCHEMLGHPQTAYTMRTKLNRDFMVCPYAQCPHQECLALQTTEEFQAACACRLIYYCSGDCKAKDYPRHSLFCKNRRAAPAL